VDFIFTHHFHVLIKIVRKDLTDIQAGLGPQVKDQGMVAGVGDPVGVLGQVGIGNDIGGLPENDLLPVAQIHPGGRFVFSATGQHQHQENKQIVF
jgi:hypothetical protein